MSSERAVQGRATAAGAGRSVSNPQAPAVGPGGRLLGRFQIAGAFWLRAALFQARLPDFLRPLVLYPFVVVTWALCGGIRRTLGDNAQWVHGKPLTGWARQRAVLRTLVQFGSCFAERNESLLPGRWKSFQHAYSGIENWEASGAARGAAILITAHVGGWEVGSLTPVAKAGRRLHLVREQETSEEMQRIMASALAARGIEDYVTHFAHDPELGLELVAALRDGDLVALQGDRPRREGETLEVRLFGRPYHVPLGPFLLAHLTGAPLVPVFNLRTGRRRYHMLIRPPILPQRSRDRKAALLALAEPYVRELEAVLREAPHQWFRFGGAGSVANPERQPPKTPTRPAPAPGTSKA